jgi:hypothetical protein
VRHYSQTSIARSSEDHTVLEAYGTEKVSPSARSRKRLTVAQRDGSDIDELDAVIATCTAETYNLKKALSTLLPIYPGEDYYY